MTQKVELEVELVMAMGMLALSIGMVALSMGMVEFMVELATNGSMLTVSLHSVRDMKIHLRLETKELSNKRVHADDILNIGGVDVVVGKIGAASGREVGGGRIQ